MKQNMTLAAAIAAFLSLSSFVTANDSFSDVGLVGGSEGTFPNHVPYSAYLTSGGAVAPLTISGFPTDPDAYGVISSVAINSSSKGIIGGSQTPSSPFTGYAAFTFPAGAVNPIALPVVSPNTVAHVTSVDINSSGYGIVGAEEIAPTHKMYAALVDSSGTATQVTFPDPSAGNKSAIHSVSINDSRKAVVGGKHNKLPYAAFIHPGETAASAISIGGTGGYINSVAINNSGNAIIGGVKDDHAYAALVSDGSNTPLFSTTFSGKILSVAINDAGQAIIGGKEGSNAYLATVTSGTPFPITAVFGGGEIKAVDINASGEAVFGGTVSGQYAALVLPDGSIRELTGTPPTGSIDAVAISNAGFALVGGGDYLGLVAPNGAATALSAGDSILSVAINGEKAISSIVPSSYGAGNAFADPIFSLSTVVLRNHTNNPSTSHDRLALVASTTNKIYSDTGPSRSKYTLWLAPFGTYSKYRSGNSFPTVRNRSIGGMLGFDYNEWDWLLVGGGLAYAYQDINYLDDMGSGKVHQELASLYATWYGPVVTIDGALFGGIYQLENHRKTLGFLTSKSNVDGGLLAAHLGVEKEISYSQRNSFTPFGSLDWVNNWQGEVRETGKSGFNMRIDSHWISLLRTELGIRLAQRFKKSWGELKLEEGGSYVNKVPFNADKVSGFFVGSVSTFNLALFNDEVQNLGALYLAAYFTPTVIDRPVISMQYQGEFGGKQISNTLVVEFKQRF